MADANANIRIDVDTSDALAQIKALQRQISIFHTSMSQSGKAAASSAAKMQANLVNSINATKGFTAGMVNIESSTESFTRSLEKNKFSMGEYFRYAGASTKTFGSLFKTEFETIGKVARERVKDLQTQYIKMGRGANGALQAIKIRPTNLDLKDFGTQTAIAAQKQQLFNQLIKQGSTNLLNWGKNTQWAGRQLMVGFTIPLTIMGAAAAKEFMKLEEQAIRFKRVYGELFTTSEETNKAIEDIKRLANEFTKYGVAVEKTMELAADIAAMGKMGAELNAQVVETTRLAVLGGVDQAEALKATISLTDAFGTSAEDLAGKIDFLNAVENQTVTSIEDLTVAIPKAGPVVKQLGGDIQDLTFFLTAMREGGINASESANALKSGLASLINPTKVSSEFLQKMGISISGIVEANKGDIRGTVVEFAQALDTLDPLNRARAIEQLFGKFQFARISTLFQNVIKEGNQASRVLELTNAANEELAILSERELKRVEDSPMFKFKKTIEEFKVSLAPIGEAFLKLATPLIEFGNKVLDQFNKMSDGTKQFIVGAVAIGGVVAPAVIMVIGLLANAVANTIKFGLLLKNTLTGTTQSTDILTDQLTYMNSEQIEAAAVAASLDQVHTRLRQTFTSEAAAVDALTAAYTRAITKQNQMMMAPGGAGKPPRGGKKPPGYADGVISVPGPKGAGDIVPAMLSPGEAVIPAGLAKKYAPLIDAMFKNRIPGYEDGFQPAYGGEGLTKRVAEYYRDNGIPHPAAPKSVAPIPAYGGEGLTKKVAEYYRDNGILHPAAPKPVTPTPVARKAQRPDRAHLQPALDPNNPAVRSQILQLYPNYDQMDPELKAKTQFSGSLVAELPPTANQRLKPGSKTPFKPDEFVSIWESLDDKMLSSAVAGGLDPNNPEARKALKEIEQQVGRKASDLAKNAGGSVTDGILAQATDQVLEDAKKAKGMKSQVASQLESRKLVLGDVRGKFYKEDYEKHLASGKMVQKGTQIIDPTTGAVLGAERRSNSGKPTRLKQSTKHIPKFRGYASQKRMSTPRDPKAALMVQRDAVQDVQTYNKTSEAEMKKSPKTDKYVQSRKRKSPHVQAAQDGKADAVAYNKASQTESQKQQNASGGRRGKIAAGVKGLGGKIATGGMALSGMAMAASMVPGKVGETAQGLIMPLMALSMVLPLLTSAGGIAVVALGALAAAIIWTKMSFDKLQGEQMELTESLSGGSKALEEFGKAAGKVAAGEVMDKRREAGLGVFQIQPGKNTFGNNFMGSEAGAQMSSSVQASLAQNGSAGTQQMVTNQLATAVASGALSTAEARSIIAALATELQDYSFGIDVNAKLTSLLGPNGENLATDPLGIRIKILEESRDGITTSLNSALETSNWTGGDFGKTIGFGLGGAVAGGLAGAFAGGAIGVKIGSMIGTAVAPGIGTAIGAGLGLIAGGVTGVILGQKDRSDRIAKATGASVAIQKVALQQQQEMMDSLELEYEQRIANAQAAGNLEEVERLTNQRLIDRKALLEENKLLIDQIRQSYADAPADVRAALDTGANKAMESQYKDTALQDVVPLAQSTIEENVQDKELQYVIKMQVASGEINPMQIMEFLGTFGKGTTEQTAVINMIGNLGGAFTNQTMGLLKLLEGNEAIQSDVLLNISSAGSPEEATKLLEFYQRLSQTDSVLEREAKFKFILENPEAAAILQKKLEELNAFSGEITMDVVTRILGAEAVDALSKDLDYYQGLNDQMKKVYLQTLVTTISTVSPDDPALKNWLGGAGSAYQGKPPGEQLAAYANYNAGVVTKIAEDTTAGAGAPPADTGGGGGPKASVFDDLTKKIRDFRKETFKARVGWDAATGALNKLFDGGKKGLSVFGGLSNKLRELGAGEGMIEMIVGMDPDEYEKRKKELFKFDKDGNIVAITKKFKSLAAAVNEVALGEYINSQQSFITNTKNQIGAIAILTANGMSLADAYEAVQDEAMAAALMMGQTKKEIKEILRITGIARQLRDDMQKQQERVNIGESVKQTNEEFSDQVNILNMLAKSQGKYNDEQIKAIMGDRNLQKLLLDPSIDPGALELRLKQAAQQANLEVRIKISTAEGKKQLFDELMGDINNQFSNKEQQIDVNFRLATEADSDIVREAENKIAAIQYLVDDYEAQLKGIGDQEDAINKRYDARYEALDKVKQAQEAVTRSQKAQLDIADALSRGDIAAAARAQQELRKQQAEASAEQQRTQLERAQAAEISNVRSVSGKSRTELEGMIKSKQDEIFNIEETEVEPAQERIRLAEYGKEVAIDNLTIAGKTRDEWDKIANATSLATVNAEEFAKKIEQALALYQHFVNGKALDANLFGQEELNQLAAEGVKVGGGSAGKEGRQTGASNNSGGSSAGVQAERAALDAALTPIQKAANDLYMNRAPLNDPKTAAAASKDVAIKAGVKIGATTADQAERKINDYLKKQDQVLSKNFSIAAGTTSADRLDQKYKSALSSIGISTKIGTSAAKIAAANTASKQRAAILADKKATSGVYGTSTTQRRYFSGGAIPYSVGGRVFRNTGSDTIPAMLTPGEFVVRKRAVQNFGMKNLEKINNGDSIGGSVYNYNLAVNVKSDANPDVIAKTVIQQIKRIDSQKVRGNRI
jgi:TP901 family phage tail tape measure protein